MEIKVIYEDEYVLILDKPSGLMMHADGRTENLTLADWINENYPDLANVGEEQTLQNGEKIKRPGIVHRLDKDTSGVVVVAKTKESYEFLKEQFQNRKIEKIYHAIVYGNFSEGKMEGDARHRIDKPIGRSASDFRRWSAEYGAKGELREAITEYKVLEQNKEFAYLEINLKTGRTHQIRVHMKSISHPVVCDKLYGPNPPSHKATVGKEGYLGLSRLALHAFSIKLELPNQTHITLEAALPPEFENAKNLLKKG